MYFFLLTKGNKTRKIQPLEMIDFIQRLILAYLEKYFQINFKIEFNLISFYFLLTEFQLYYNSGFITKLNQIFHDKFQK